MVSFHKPQCRRIFSITSDWCRSIKPIIFIVPPQLGHINECERKQRISVSTFIRFPWPFDFKIEFIRIKHEIQVPMFVSPGDVVIVNTGSGDYQGRPGRI